MSQFETVTDTAVFRSGGKTPEKADPVFVEALKSTSKTEAKSVRLDGDTVEKREADAKAKLKKLRVAARELGVTAQTRQLADRIVFRQAPKRTVNRKPKGEQAAPATPASADVDVPTAERAATVEPTDADRAADAQTEELTTAPESKGSPDPMPAPTTAPARRRK